MMEGCERGHLFYLSIFPSFHLSIFPSFHLFLFFVLFVLFASLWLSEIPHSERR